VLLNFDANKVMLKEKRAQIQNLYIGKPGSKNDITTDALIARFSVSQALVVSYGVYVSRTGFLFL
jgi:hypothetical protein